MNKSQENKLKQVRMMANDLIKHYIPNAGYQFVFNNRLKRAAGRTNYTTQVIDLQVRYALYADFNTILDTIMHEIAHVLAGYGAGHGYEWRKYAREFDIPVKAKKTVKLHKEVIFYD